jgi:pimeloyl-ACP methyl ester carboxylesterase
MELFYHHFGQGAKLIILHGLFGISDNWVTIGKRLSEKYEVYIPDLRNHGRSPHSSVFTYPAMIEDVYDFYIQHGIQKAVLIGHSMGGKVAMNFALEYPEMLEKLIVVDISPRTYPYRQQHVEMIQAMSSVDFDLLITRTAVEDHLRAYITDEKIRLFVLKNLYRLDRGRLEWRLNLEAISANLDAIFEGLSAQSGFEKETLFIKGSLSSYITEEDIPLIKTYFPHSQISTIEGASHWVHSDKPGELCAVFSSFLGKECE